ncbi:uncharacterized protein LOC115922461 [Strongylocentrotus purpuratus]|uniref:Uncharacterized protein n=1 Tax=Strongylocentrotus purpuratus TaxID=7668 RepID=A0A7M7NKU3_STRPU|nr:uncharacterized protein LOC115922461 [Strongylocentrotus purpuratus]
MASADPNMFALLREDVKCAICLEQLTKPRLLICVHSFCEKCLETYYKEKQSSVGKIACPICDEETILSDAGILGLRHDFRAMTLMKRLEKEKPKQQQKTERVINKLCEVCGNIDSDSASPFFNCTECKIALCMACSKKHHHPCSADTSSRTNVAEMNLEKDDDANGTILCEKHGGKKKELFCTFCLFPVCQVCSIYDHRLQENHKCVKVEDFVPMMREEIQSRMSRLDQVGEQCAAIISMIEEAENLTKKQKDVLDKQIEDYIDEYTHCVKTDLKVKNEKFFELRNQTLNQWQKIIEDRTKIIETIQLKVYETLDQNENHSLIAILYNGLLKSLDSLLSKAPEKYIRKTIKKVMDERQLHFRLTDNESVIEANLFTNRTVHERKSIDIVLPEQPYCNDLKAVTFTRDGRVAILKVVNQSEIYYPIDIIQTTASSKVATKFGIETITEDATTSVSAFASLSDLRFVLDKYEDCRKVHGDVFHVRELPGRISDMATDLKDNIYCSVPSCKKIYVVRSDGPQTKSIPTGNLAPKRIAICPRSPNQIIFTHGSTKVSVVDWSGKLLKTITRPEWKEVAIGCDNNNILYVLWKNEAKLITLQRFYLNGDPLDTLLQGEAHSCSRLLLAVSPSGTAAVVTGAGSNCKVTLISTMREFTGDESSLPK